MKHSVYAVTAVMMVLFLLLALVGCTTQPTEQPTSGTSESATNGGTELTTDHLTSTNSTTVSTSGVSQTTTYSTTTTLYDAATTTKSSTTVSASPTKGSVTTVSTSKFTTTSTSKSTTVSTTVSTTTTTKPKSEPSTWLEMPENTNPNLKYFGYFHSDGFGSQSSYMADIAALGHANIVMINSAWNAQQAAGDLAEAKRYGFKAIVTAHGMFQYGKVGQLGSAELIYGWEDYWDEYQATVQSYIDDGTVYAFYFDEPRWNGISCEDFQTVTRYMRQKSGVGVMACMTSMDMGWSNYGNVGPCEDDYLENCTDVMFDDYSAWDAYTRRGYLQKLKDKSPEDAWLWGCPRGMEKQSDLDAHGFKRMIDHIQGQYRESVWEERYAGIISFSFANGINEGDWGYGMCDFFDPAQSCYSEELRGIYQDIGIAIIENAQ